MFDAMLIFCIVHALDGEPRNQCYGTASEEIFRTYKGCREWADQKEIEFSAVGLKQTGNLFVTQITCGKLSSN